MAAAHQVIFSAPVFGPRNQQALYRHENHQTTDVFSRERTSAAVSDPGPRRVKVLIPIGGESIELTYCGPSLPAWAKPVLKSLPERWGAGPAWDSHRAVPTRLHLVVSLLNALSTVMLDELPTPQITALSDGGVQAEWHGVGGDLEIVIAAGEVPSYYFFNRTTNDEEDNALEGHERRVHDLIGGLC